MIPQQQFFCLEDAQTPWLKGFPRWLENRSAMALEESVGEAGIQRVA